LDLIGLDVMDLVGKNLAANLAAGDPGLECAAFPATEQKMLERGQLGRKTGGGFSRVNKLEDGTREKEIFDLTTEEWRPAGEPDLSGVPGDLGEVMFTETEQGRLAWEIFGGGLRYAADLVPEISDDIVNIDRAMRWGFNWAMGPFELLDTIGTGRVIDKLKAEGRELPAMLAVLEASGSDTFYRNDGAEFLGIDGAWHQP
jgi:3-hydroxyacyl-CoA dehydrogenase